MTDKKNIERLFQEKFKDFEVTPNPEAWENIASRLEKKENKKRIFPFWFNAKAVGIAAALVLGFFGLNNYSKLFTWTLLDSNTKGTVVVQESKSNSKTSSSEQATVTSSKSIITDLSTMQQASSVATANNPALNGNDGTNYKKNSNQIVTSSSAIDTNEKTTPSNSYKNIRPSVQYLNNSNEIFVSNEKRQKRNSPKTKSEYRISNNTSLDISNNEVSPKKEATVNSVASISNEKFSFEKNPKTLKENSDKYKIQITLKSNLTDPTPFQRISNVPSDKFKFETNIQNNSSVVDNDKSIFTKKEKIAKDNFYMEKEKNPLEKRQNGILRMDISKTSLEGYQNNVVVAENKNNSAIISNSLTTAVVAIDSSKNKTLEENPLQKILKEKEKLAKNTEEQKEKTKSDWLIKPTIAPIFMFAKNGSPINEKFADNSKTYNSTFSVGIGLEKRLSDRFYFRTSVNNLDLSYNTNDIAYHSILNISDPSGRGLGNISLSQSALFTTIEDSRDTTFDNSGVLQNKKEGYLNQKISYVEIPLEFSYKLIDKKIGIQVITGLSTLFLNKNQVSLVSDNFSSDIGEANNLNSIHFSTNIGLGFKYRFFKSFEASVEPTLKYQLFTFHTNAGGFKPYIVGLYSGVSYRF